MNEYQIKAVAITSTMILVFMFGFVSGGQYFKHQLQLRVEGVIDALAAYDAGAE